VIVLGTLAAAAWSAAAIAASAEDSSRGSARLFGVVTAPLSASPQALSKATANVHFNVKWLNYSGQYEIQFESLTTLGTVTALDWIPPANLAVAAITDSQGGTCIISTHQGITCQTSLSPPSCSGDTCYPADGLLTVYFTAKLTGIPPGSTFADLFWGSYLQVTGLSPTPATFNDLPLCKRGQVSTRRHLCLKP
jgi:hypothetical protein